MPADEKALTRESERIRLRPIQDGDLDRLVEKANDERISQFTDLPYPYERDHAATVISLAREERRLGKSYHLAIASLDDDALVGMAGLVSVDQESQNAEVGFWVSPDHWGKGLAFEAVDLLLEIAYEGLDLTKLYGVVLEGNEASIELLERLRFTEEGRLRWHTKRGDRWMDKIFYGLLREEWERRTGRAR